LFVKKTLDSRFRGNDDKLASRDFRIRNIQYATLSFAALPLSLRPNSKRILLLRIPLRKIT
jgi:hypothetical protein